MNKLNPLIQQFNQENFSELNQEVKQQNPSCTSYNLSHNRVSSNSLSPVSSFSPASSLSPANSLSSPKSLATKKLFASKFFSKALALTGLALSASLLSLSSNLAQADVYLGGNNNNDNVVISDNGNFVIGGDSSGNNSPALNHSGKSHSSGISSTSNHRGSISSTNHIPQPQVIPAPNLEVTLTLPAGFHVFNPAGNKDLTPVQNKLLWRLGYKDKHTHNVVYAYKLDDKKDVVAIVQLATADVPSIVTHSFSFLLWLDKFKNILSTVREKTYQGISRITKVNYLSKFQKTTFHGEDAVYFDARLEPPSFAKSSLHTNQIYLEAYMFTSNGELIRLAMLKIKDYSDYDQDRSMIYDKFQFN